MSTPNSSVISPVQVDVQESKESKSESKESKRSRAVSESELAEANRRILEIGQRQGYGAMMSELFKHPVTGEGLDYAESRMYYG